MCRAFSNYPALGFKPNTSDKGYVVLEKDDEHNKAGKTALYRYEDIGHRSKLLEYHFVSDDEDVIKKYLIGERLYKLQRAYKFDEE